MILRTVRMTFHPDRIEAFCRLFAESRARIRASPGCTSLELWQDPRFPNILTTVSLWASEEALEAYRESAFFRETWHRTAVWFAAPPEAHSHRPVLLPLLDPG